MKKASGSPSVSIAMATYNGAKYIREQLDSIGAQTFLPFELVVTDDGSTDRTLDIVREFALTAPFRVRIFSATDRLGYGDNFFYAVSLCTGDLIAFCDQDDVWVPEKLSRSVSSFRNRDVVMTSHNAVVIDQHGVQISGRRVRYHVRCVDKIEKKYWSIYLGFTLVFRNHDRLRLSDGGALRPFRDFGLQHDEVVYFLYATWGKIGAIDADLVKYRRHGHNASGATEVHSKIDKLESLRSAYRVLRRRCIMAKALGWPDPEGQKQSLRAPLLTARQLRARISVYQMGFSRRARLRFIVRNFLGGVYSNSPRAGLGTRALVSDLVFLFSQASEFRKRSLTAKETLC